MELRSGSVDVFQPRVKGPTCLSAEFNDMEAGNFLLGILILDKD